MTPAAAVAVTLFANALLAILARLATAMYVAPSSKKSVRTLSTTSRSTPCRSTQHAWLKNIRLWLFLRIVIASMVRFLLAEQYVLQHQQPL